MGAGRAGGKFVAVMFWPLKSLAESHKTLLEQFFRSMLWVKPGNIIFPFKLIHWFHPSGQVTLGTLPLSHGNYCFPPKFVDPLRLPVWRHIVTGKSLRPLVQISKGYDSYLDERGRGKANKLANIAIYRLFDWMCVSFGVAIICLYKPFWYFVSVIV